MVADRSLRQAELLRELRRRVPRARAAGRRSSRAGRPRAPAAAPARERRARRPRRSPAVGSWICSFPAGEPRRPARRPPRAISSNEQNGPLIRNVRLFPPVRKSPVRAGHGRCQAPVRNRQDFATRHARSGGDAEGRGEFRDVVNGSLQSRDTSVTGPGSGRGSPGHRLPGRGGDRRRGAPQRARRGAAPGSRRGRQGRCGRRRGGRGGADVLHAVVVEADPGAAARSGARRPRRARPRDRVRVPPRDRRPDRRRARAPREGARHRGRPRDSGCRRGVRREKLFHNCSGKHAGMLALCRAHGWPLEGYRLPDHPVQQRLPATRTPRPRTSTRRSCRPRPTAAASSRSRSRSSGWRMRSPASSSCRARPGSPTRCARTRSSSAAPTASTSS